jgi:hypothetical protein
MAQESKMTKQRFISVAAVLIAMAAGCTQPADDESKEEQPVAAEAKLAAAPAASSPSGIACRTGTDQTIKVADPPPAPAIDPSYRAPAQSKPDPDIRTVPPPPPRPADVEAKLLERQAKYMAELPALQAKHPQKGEAFEKARAELKERIINAAEGAAGP